MRRFFLAIAVIPLALGVAGCGATSGPNDPTTTRPYPNTVEGTAPTTTRPTTGGGGVGKGDPVAGKAVFMSQPCGSCHTLADANTTGQVGPNLDEAMPSYPLVVARVTNGMGVMPAFKGQLTTKQIQDVAAYVSSVAGK